MTTTTAADGLPPVALLHPMTLADITAAARQPGTTSHTIARYLDKWLESAGKAKDALATAPAEELAAYLTADVGFPDWCEECRTPLPAWVECVRDDHRQTFCVTCAVDDQRVNPSNWREVMADAAADVFGHDQ